MKLKRKDMIKQVKKNNEVYPKNEAILVYKDKDSEDRRRVIYKMEDGYRRYGFYKKTIILEQVN